MTTTGGTGGALTDRLNQPYTSSNGYGNPYHIYAAGIDPAKPVGLFVWLHGDGGYEFYNPTSELYLAGPDGIVAAAKERNMIVLVPLTPDDRTGEGVTWWKWGGQTSNTQFVREMIQTEVFNKYNVDREKVWIAGFSGGAEFVTSQFLPWQGNNLGIEGGGFMVFGGGAANTAYGHTMVFDLPYKNKFPGYWITGENDTAANAPDNFDGVGAAQTGHDWYASKGYTTDLKWVAGRTHILSPDWGNLTREAWSKYDASNLPPGMAGLDMAKARELWLGPDKVKGLFHGSQRFYPAEQIFEYNVFTPGTYNFEAPRGEWLCDVLIVGAGGGSGGVATSGRGSKAGSLGEIKSITWTGVSGGNFVITIGGGGSAGAQSSLSTSNGGAGGYSKAAIGWLSLQAEGGAGGEGNLTSSVVGTGWQAQRHGLSNHFDPPMLWNLQGIGRPGEGREARSGNTGPGNSGLNGYAWVRFRPVPVPVVSPRTVTLTTDSGGWFPSQQTSNPLIAGFIANKGGGPVVAFTAPVTVDEDMWNSDTDSLIPRGQVIPAGLYTAKWSGGISTHTFTEVL